MMTDKELNQKYLRKWEEPHIWDDTSMDWDIWDEMSDHVRDTDRIFESAKRAITYAYSEVFQKERWAREEAQRRNEEQIIRSMIKDKLPQATAEYRELVYANANFARRSWEVLYSLLGEEKAEKLYKEGFSEMSRAMYTVYQIIHQNIPFKQLLAIYGEAICDDCR